MSGSTVFPVVSFRATWRVLLAAPLVVVVYTASAADWNATGGTVPDASWSGDTPAVTGNRNVGALAGDGGVSGGGATYAIPITVVPGRAGMEPAVSLNYSSDAGNGIAGVGWSLSVGSAISRCGRTLAQDGVTDRIHFLKSKDRLCLNGQRLVAVSGGYGNSGTEYRSEIDSFVKVVQSGDMDGTTTYFTVTHKNGNKDYFGQTPDSRHSLQGVTKTSTWQLSKSTDVSGNNTINYVYQAHPNGEYTLSSINYTGQGASAGDRFVEFDYETRPDTRNGFQAGGMYERTKRLKSITTRYQSQIVRQYRLSYAVSATSGNSLLRSAEECGYIGSTSYCFPATQFNWYENAPEYKFERMHFVNSAGQKVYIGATGSVNTVLPKKDMNGDGTLDWPSVFINAEGEFKADNNYENLGNCAMNQYTYQTRCMNADFNKDGLTDSWKLTHGSTRVFQYAYANYNGAPPVLVNTPVHLQASGYLGDELLGIGDLNGDGYDDLLVRRAIQPNSSGSYLGTARVVVYLHTKNHNAPYSSVNHYVYTIPARRVNYSWQLDQTVELMDDFDGNGIEDVYVFQTDISLEASSTFSASFHKPRFRRVILSQSSAGYSGITKSFGENMTSSFGEGGPMPEYRNHEQFFDINGDGLKDLIGVLFNGYQYRINLGNGELGEWLYMMGSDQIVNKVKKGVVAIERSQNSGGPFSFSSYYEPRMVPSFVLDYDQNGIEDMMVPTERVVSHCFEHPVMVTTSGNWDWRQFCDDEMYAIGGAGGIQQPPISDINDRSIYRYDRVKFDITGYAPSGLPIVSVSLVPTDVVSMVTQGAAADVFGNGHTDFVTMISCATTGRNCRYGDANGNNDLNDFVDDHGTTLTLGAYINRNTGSYGTGSSDTGKYEVVDRLESVTTALDDRVEWDYKPLNTGRAGPDFYSVNQAHLGSNPGYLHFSANINVVEEVRYSDGIGGLRAYRYKYQDATLSSQGRGFQGYKRIIVDDVANEMRSVSDYHVLYPATGQLAETRSCPISAGDLECDGRPVEKNTYTWDLWRDGLYRVTIYNGGTNFSGHVLDGSSSENRYWIAPRTQTTKHYKTSSSHSASNGAVQPIAVSNSWTHKTTDYQQFDASGHGCPTLTRSTYEEPNSANKSETETATTYYAANTGTWWLCKTNYEDVTVKAVSGRTSDFATIESGSDVQKRVRTTYTWNSTHRKPYMVTTQATQGGGRPTRVTNVYNSHGLATSVNVEGSAYNSSSYNLADRTTTTSYTADGYFVASVTNAKGHVTTTLTDARLGAPTQVTDPNGQVTAMTYDYFGRLASSKAPGEPTVRLGYWWCSGINNGTAWCPTYDHPRYRILTRATGTPDTYRYFDRLEREVHKLVRNFTNNNWYRDRRSYYATGNLRWETNYYDNRSSANSKYTYYDGYDNLGRLTQKRTPQANDTNLQTNYAYDGHTVNITARSSGVGANILQMSRKINGLGQLVTTTDAMYNVTEYAYDGAGNPIALEDAENNVITTRFNALGQKEWVHDPNAGDRVFKYNSLGELEWEQDANGNVIAHSYDTLGRIFNRWTNGVYSGIWRYDKNASYGRKGMIDYEYNTTSNADRLVKYYRYGTTTGGKDYLYYTWHYIYENGSLPTSNRHRTIYYVDNNYGRPKGVRYDTTGITTAYEYTSAGYVSKVKNASSGYAYREISDMGPHGNIIQGSMGNGVLHQAQAHHPATGQMTRNNITKAAGGAVVHELEYDYDGFGNLYQSVVTAKNGLPNYETFTYDNLHRLIQSDRAFSSENVAPVSVNYNYSATGNITQKNDYFVSAAYGNAARSAGGNAGPNAIRQIVRVGGGSTTYTYDDNGNMLSGDGRTLTYNEFNKPLSITKGGVTSHFSYGANLLRYKQIKTGLSGGAQTTYHVDRHLEIEKQGSRTTYRHYLDGIAILNKEVTGSTTEWTLGFHLKDRLGSVVTLADQNGDVLEHRSYDPFGKPRRGDYIDASAGTIKAAIAEDPHEEHSSDPLTDRGYTDHEHLDDQQIIHMNGRVYDYNVARFASIDPFIQVPKFSQSVNPYSYIMNNPLAGTDPSGYAKEDEQPRKVTDVRMKQWKRQTKYSGGTMLRKVNVTIPVIVKDEAGGNGGSTNAAPEQTSNGGGSSVDVTGGTPQSNPSPGGQQNIVSQTNEDSMRAPLLTRDEFTEIVIEQSTAELRSGAFVALGVDLKVVSFNVDFDAGSLRKDVITGERSVTTGATVAADIFGFGFEAVMFERDTTITDFAPGCLYCLDSVSEFRLVTPDLSRSSSARPGGKNSILSGGLGLGGAIGTDPLGTAYHSATTAFQRAFYNHVNEQFRRNLPSCRNDDC